MELTPLSYIFGGKAFTGYLADGSRGARVPGALVAHEGPGLNAHAKERARKVAELGYVALAMDIYGEVDPPLERAKELLRSLRNDLSALRGRARAALEALAAQPHVDVHRLAAIGFCFGGMTVLELARDGAALAAVVGFHAALATTAPQDAAAIKGKVLVCLGADDPIIGAAERAAFAAEMTAARVDWQMALYGGAGHSFTNRDIDAHGFPGFAYHALADRRSWSLMRDFLEEALAG